MISPRQLFYILFVVRVVVCLTYIQAVSVGKFSSDLLLSFLLSYVLVIVSSIPILICVSKNKKPLDIGFVKWFYALYFILYSALNISRFSYFVTTKMNTGMSMLIFITISFLAVCYGASLGIEALGRFGGLCGVVLIATVLIVFVCVFNDFEYLNFFPIFENTNKNFIQNTLLFSSNSIQPALLLCLSKYTNGDVKKPYFAGVSLSYLVVFLLLFFAHGVLGGNANLQAFPIYALFQMTSIFETSRLDVLHTSVWIISMFLKSCVLVFCASSFFQKIEYKSCVKIVSFIGFCISLAINFLIGTNIVVISKYVTVILFVLAVLVIPFVCIFRRVNEKN